MSYFQYQKRKIPNDAVYMLRYLQRKLGFKSALIAGGVVRDSYFNNVFFSDVDVFLWHPNYSDENTSNEFVDPVPETFIQHLKLDHRDHVSKAFESYDEERAKHIENVYNLYVNHTYYQFVFTKTNPLKYVTQHFDIGLCQAYCDGQKIRYTPNFMTDANDKALTICGDITADELRYCWWNHLPKLRMKYPNFSPRFTVELVERLGPDIVVDIMNNP